MILRSWLLIQTQLLETTKTAVIVDNNCNGINDLGDTITYTITVENKGNVSLTGLGLVDTLTDGNGGSLILIEWTYVC